ncbi:uncharacterized protein LOC117174498 isoform X1 [Belonocnema kinseyi]|uniref:uncharacterized protein LOC117174498 isoform X1 n=1 Tax=Belonocnema kinseyi TaxID=2817044 RepID=UPI00143CE85A|nr:uncharacterized protein LOC117174498 isoform X1 [Belonocnema kinseyi]
MTGNSIDQKNNTQNMNKSLKIVHACILKNFALWDNQSHKTTMLKLIYSSVKHLTENRRGILSNDTLKNLQRMLVINAANKCKCSPINSKQLQEDITFFGVNDVAKFEINDSDNLEVKSVIEAKLREDIHDFIIRYSDLGGNLKDVPKNLDKLNKHFRQICCQKNELQLLNWKKKINEIYIMYEKHLMMICKLLIGWPHVKGKLNETQFKNTEDILLQVQFTETQTNISKLSCKLRMFLESPACINALKTLSMNLDTKIHEIDCEIQRKSNFKKEYEDLKSTEYDEILKKYTDMCNAVKKKKMLYDRL